MIIMNEKEKVIAAAAIQIFARYGIKRATMNDIAREAGVVRQTLYNVFPNKDAVIRGTIRLYAASQMEKIQSGWSSANGLEEKLDILFECYVLESWEMIRNSPDAEELERGFNAAGREEFALAGERTLQALTDLLAPYEDVLARRNETPASLADFIYNSISGIKYGARSLDHVKELIKTTKAVTLALLELG